jgi:hypothetical protein
VEWPGPLSGQIWRGKVQAIWQGSGAGQMLPSGTLPNFHYVPSETPQGQFAVAITLDDPDQVKFPIGTQGRAAIYTNPDSAFVILRKVALRGYSWYNWLYPFSGDANRPPLFTVAVLAGCALRFRPPTDVVDQAPWERRSPPRGVPIEWRRAGLTG